MILSSANWSMRFWKDSRSALKYSTQRFLHAGVAVRVGQTISCPCLLWSGLSLSIVMLPFWCLLPPILKPMTGS